MAKKRLKDNKHRAMNRRLTGKKTKMNKEEKLENKLKSDADRVRTAKDLASKRAKK